MVMHLANEGIPVVLTCRVLEFSKQAYFEGPAASIPQTLGTMRT